MRINKYIASRYEVSRRTADELIVSGKVSVNGLVPANGQQVSEEDTVVVKGHKPLEHSQKVTLLLHKPRGYVCSRVGQGAKTVYELLPAEYKMLKIAGRLDKDSSGLVLLTNDGDLVQKMTHPSLGGEKVYEVTLNKPLSKQAEQQIQRGVNIGDARLSRMKLSGAGSEWQVTLQEGRNRQIRRTFSKLGYEVVTLHRTQIGKYSLKQIADSRKYVII